MSFLDFHPRRRIVERHGRRYVCRPPTHATVVRLIELLPLAIVACAEVVKASEVPVEHDRLLPLFLTDAAAAADILSTCCTLHGASPGDFEAAATSDDKLLHDLARTVLSLCDAGRIATALNLDAVVPDKEEGAPDGMETAYVLLAERFGISPLDVPNWPYEAVLSTIATTQYIEEKRADHVKGTDGSRPSSGGKVVSMPLDGPSPVGGVIRKVRPRPVRRG